MSPYPVDTSAVAGAVLAFSPELRSNLAQRDIVGRGIALLREHGTLAAIEYLKRHAINPRIIERVLLEPGRRAAT